jgi:excisionase family DNA binding protein
MNNPFESIEARLRNIEDLILDLKHQPQQVINSPPTEQLLTVQEAADFLKLTIATIYSKVSRGELPVMKTSKRLYFSQTELLEYVKSGRRKSNANIEEDAQAYLSKTTNTK